MATRKTNRLRSLLPDDVASTLIVAGALADRSSLALGARTGGASSRTASRRSIASPCSGGAAKVGRL